MSYLYDCDCEDCSTETKRINLAWDSDINFYLQFVDRAIKKLHADGTYSPEELFKVPAYKSLINATADIYKSAIVDNDMPQEMLRSLREDVFIFSGLKTHAQLFEASRQLLTDDGKVKSFNQFSNDVKGVAEEHKKYLEAEYQFAITSAQMAGKWAQVSTGYDLQYRTAFDDRVRESHRALHDITLPADDAFWLSYYPPNGWRCRCTTVQVRKGKYPASDSEKSIEAGEKATTQEGKDGKNRLAIFRFNPGQQKVVFPPSHPYSKVKGSTEVKAGAKEIVKQERNFVPKELEDYTKPLGVKVNTGIFEYLSRETPLKTQIVKPGQRSPGAFYNPAGNSVHIPVDDRRRNSKWWAEAVIYHEFGHAADWQNGFKKMPAVTDLMDKYRSSYSKKKYEGFKELDVKLAEYQLNAHRNHDPNMMEKVAAVADTAMSLNPKFGFGHSKSYFAIPGNKEAEFLAHTFENKFVGNEVFKELMPDLYEDMIKLADELKTKVK